MGASATTAQLGSDAGAEEPSASTPQPAGGIETDALGSSAPALISADLIGGRPIADDQLFALHEVAKALSREKSIHSTLRLIAEKARQLTKSSSAALCRLDEGRTLLDFAAVAGRSASEMVGLTMHVDHAINGPTAVTGEQLLAYNPDAAATFNHDGTTDYRDYGDNFIQGGGICSAAIVPIFVNGISAGSLCALNRQGGESFTASDLLLLHILASSAAVAIQQETLRRQSAQKERERDILFETARTTSSTLNVQDILDGMLATLARSVDLFCAMVFLLNDEHSHLFIAAERGLLDDEREIQLLADGRLASTVLDGTLGGTPLLITSPETDPRYEAILPEERARPLCWMVAPLVSRDKQLGLIAVASLQRHAYTDEDLHLLSAVAAPAAVALENAELYEEATRRTEEATAIYELSQAVNTNLNLHRVLNFVADSVLALLKVDKFALFLHDPKTQCLEIKVARNIRIEAVEQMRPTRLRGGIAWWVYEYETPAAVQNVSADHRNRSLPIDQEGVASLVSVPLQAGDDVIGVIHAMSSRLRSFTVGEMELLYTIANQVGVAISNIQILEDTRQKSAELRRASRRVARALGIKLDSAQTAQMIVDLAADIMQADRCLLYTIDSHRTLTLSACHGLRTQGTVELGRDGRELSVRWVVRKGRILVIEDPARDGKFAPPAALMGQLGKSSSYIGMPLKIGTGVVGVLEVYSRDPRSFPLDEVRQFMAFTAQAAIALQNALVLEKAGRRKQYLALLSKLADMLAAPVAEEVTGRAMGLLREAIGADAIAFIRPRRKDAIDCGDTSASAWNNEALMTALTYGEYGNNGGGAGIMESGFKQAVLSEDAESNRAGGLLATVALSNGEIRIVRIDDETPFDAGELYLARTVGQMFSAR